MNTKLIYKLLQQNDRKVKVTINTVSPVKRAKYRLYARIIAAGKK